MTSTQSLLNWRRLRLLLALWLLLASLYTLTYSGLIETGDTRRLLDAVGSFVDHGDQYIDLAAWQFPPQDYYAEYPLQTVNIEPLQIVASAPLYWLAKHTPNLGLVHTTYLFNVLVGATIGSVLFLYVLALGYDERTAVLATIIFGIGTAIFPYAKTFFREPLMMLCLLAAGLCIERLRANVYRSIPLFIAGVVALLALTLTKVSGLLALPALLVIALPSMRGVNRRLLIALGIVGLLLAGVFLALGVFDLIPGLSARFNIIARLSGASAQYLPVAVHSYLFSVGGSIWGTSPIVLLALPGGWLLLRRGGWRYPAAAVLMLLAFAFGYALLNGVHWFGGLSWPPRFLIPILPFLFIVGLPALDWLAHRPRSFWMVPAALLLAYSVWVQLSGVALWWGEYPQHLPEEAANFIEWGGGLNQVEYLRWVIIPQLWSFRPLDNAWVEVDALIIPALLGVLVVACGVWVWRELKVGARHAISPEAQSLRLDKTKSPEDDSATQAVKQDKRTKGALVGSIYHSLPFERRAILPIVFTLFYLLITWAGLRVLYERDERYRTFDESLHAMLPMLQEQTTADDVILLSTPGYEPFFLNYYKNFGSGRAITLPLQPGEQPSPEQPPQVRSDFPAALLTNETAPLIHALAHRYQGMWLLVEFGPDLGWSTRPVERFMTAHYYPIDYQQTAPQTRLIEYSTVNAPDMFGFRAPERLTDLLYRDAIRLVGFDLRAGTSYAPGDALPVSLYWQTDVPLEANYSVALFLSPPNSPPITQSDWQPMGFFAPTSRWQVGVPVWDNRALRIPPDLPPGEYQLWVKVYDNPGGTPQDLWVAGTETMDDVIGILPVTITVRNE